MTRGRRWRWLLPALCGLVAVGAGLGVAELVAAFVAPAASPFLTVGSFLIDAAPGWAKHLAIDLLGKDDKPALLTAIGVVVAVLAALAGVLEERRPPVGRVLISAAGVLGIVAALTRAGAGPADAVPAFVAALGAFVVIDPLLRRLPPRRGAAEPASDPGVPEEAGTEAPAGPDRRRFLGWVVGTAVVGALTAAGGFALETGTRTATAVRSALKLPKPVTPAPALPAGADFDIPGLAPIVTPDDAFYRIDTALQVPQIDPADWSLRVTGMVDHELTLTWDELLALPLVESWTTLTCVSNEVGGDLIGNARWLGYPIRELLRRAGPSADADMVFSTSQDGFTASTPLEALVDDDREALLAVGMNGQPLPPEHGFPVRMVVPGLYGYVSATKWVVKLEVTTYAKRTAYWTAEGWSERGPIKLESRIDVARPRTDGADDWVVAGVAWHQHVGVQGVELRVDRGDWMPTTLSAPISRDTWVQWRTAWRPTPGTHTLTVRATGADGEVQTAAVADVVPDGASGYHSLTVHV